MNDEARSHETAIEPAVVQRAAQWMARLWSGEAGDGDRAACAHWRAAHPDHERAWQRLQVLEDKLHGVPRDAARNALLEPAAVSPSRRRVLKVLGLTIAVGGVGYAARETDTWQRAFSDYRSRTGEIRAIGLPDGTRIVLDTASAIDVRFNDRERRVILRTGEILVTTAADPAPVHRPFIVQSRQGSVQALGTRFTVRQDVDASRVAVYEGAVDIRPFHANGVAWRLDAGQRTGFSKDGVEPFAAASESGAAWSRGVLVAERMRVADFIAELGRYRPGILRCEPAVADLRVTGVFSLRDTDRALANLALGLPVEVVYRTSYWVTVRKR